MTKATTFRTTAIIGAVLLTLLMIMTVSRAAFSDPTSNNANYVAAGSVVLDNNAPNGGTNTNPGDESGDPMFGAAAQAAGGWTVQADNLAPGDSVAHCIDIRYKGSLDATVALSSVKTGMATATDFADKINLTIQRFAGSGCSSTGSDAVAAGTLSSPGLSADSWSATGGGDTDVMSYEITLELDSAAGNEFQGATLGDIEFSWLAGQA